MFTLAQIEARNEPNQADALHRIEMTRIALRERFEDWRAWLRQSWGASGGPTIRVS